MPIIQTLLIFLATSGLTISSGYLNQPFYDTPIFIRQCVANGLISHSLLKSILGKSFPGPKLLLGCLLLSQKEWENILFGKKGYRQGNPTALFPFILHKANDTQPTEIQHDTDYCKILLKTAQKNKHESVPLLLVPFAKLLRLLKPDRLSLIEEKIKNKKDNEDAQLTMKEIAHIANYLHTDFKPNDPYSAFYAIGVGKAYTIENTEPMGRDDFSKIINDFNNGTMRIWPFRPIFYLVDYLASHGKFGLEENTTNNWSYYTKSLSEN